MSAPQQCPSCGAVYTAGGRARCALDDHALGPLGGDALVGRTVGGFRVEALIAAGRSHRVYRAVDERVRRMVALKVAHGEVCADAALKRAYLIAASKAELRDPELFVHVVDARASEEGVALVALELVEGRTLEAALAAGERFAAADVARWALTLANGLHTLHRKGRAYGGVEARTVWLDADPSGGVRARWLDASLAEAGGVRAGPDAAPPEGGSSPAGDVYGLGVVLAAAGDAGGLTSLVTSMRARAPAERPTALSVAERAAAALGVGVPAAGSQRPRRADPPLTRADSARPAKRAEPARTSTESPPSADVARSREERRAPRASSRWPLAALAVAAVGVAAALGLRDRSGGEDAQAAAVTPSPSVTPVSSATIAAAIAPFEAAAMAGGPDAAVSAADAGLRAADAGLRAADAGLRAADAGLRAADAGLRAADAGLRAADAGLRAADAGLRAADASTRAADASTRARVVDPGLGPPPSDAAQLRFESCDRQLGRALKDHGLTFADVEREAPDQARQWARWYKRNEPLSMDAVEAACAVLLEVAARASP